MSMASARDHRALVRGHADLYIHNMKDARGLTDFMGANPFDNGQVEQQGAQVRFSRLYPTYDWVADDGRERIGSWIEAAARKAGR